jgi:hypoxanthine-DNA glycosylase
MNVAPARGRAGVPPRPRSASLLGFEPVADRRARTLILGSFPSEASQRAGHYYAHPRNQFWPILSELLGEPLVNLPFEARYRRLRAHRIALWDVIQTCERPGSLDASIREAQSNDFDALLRLAPRLERDPLDLPEQLAHVHLAHEYVLGVAGDLPDGLLRDGPHGLQPEQADPVVSRRDLPRAERG